MPNLLMADCTDFPLFIAYFGEHSNHPAERRPKSEFEHCPILHSINFLYPIFNEKEDLCEKV